MHENQLEQNELSPYSTDQSPSDFHLFGPLIEVQDFADDEGVEGLNLYDSITRTIKFNTSPPVQICTMSDDFSQNEHYPLEISTPDKTK